MLWVIFHIRKSQAFHRRRHAIHSWINVEGRWTRNLEGEKGVDWTGICSLNQSHRSCFLSNNNNHNNNNNYYIYIIYIYIIYIVIYISYIYIIYQSYIYHIYIWYIYHIYIYHIYITYIYIYHICICNYIYHIIYIYYISYQYLYSIWEYMYDILLCIYICVCAILHVGRWYGLAITITLAHTPSRIDVDGRGEHAITQAVGVFHVHLEMGSGFQVRPEQVEQKHLVENYHDLHGENMGKW